MSNSPQNNKRRRRRKPVPLRNILFYCSFLVICALVLYAAVFSPAYSIGLVHDSNPGTQTVPGNSGDGTQISQPEYKTYPDTGEKVATVLIDAGHGGIDSGKPMSDGILEKDLNLSFALKLGAALEELNPQLEIKYIRTDDNITWGNLENDDLNHRLEQQWLQEADYFISLHCNAYEGDPSVEGTVFFINPDDPVMKAIAEKFQENLSAISWADNYQIIDNELLQLVSMSDIHSILIELGYMTNPDDLANLTSEEMQTMCARALAAAISDYIMENPDAPAYTNPRYYRGQLLSTEENSESSQTPGGEPSTVPTTPDSSASSAQSSSQASADPAAAQ